MHKILVEQGLVKGLPGGLVHMEAVNQISIFYIDRQVESHRSPPFHTIYKRKYPPNSTFPRRNEDRGPETPSLTIRRMQSRLLQIMQKTQAGMPWIRLLQQDFFDIYTVCER